VKLWILKAKPGAKAFQPSYDKMLGLVVRAGDANEARDLASQRAGDETKWPWFDTNATSCEELTVHGGADILLIDYHGS